jgi:hypothetical protein
MRLAAVTTLSILFLAARAFAQDGSEQMHADHMKMNPSGGYYNHGHAENHDWYRKLMQPGTTYSCCNGDTNSGDCRPTRAYQGEDGFWHAQVDGRWVTVPQRAVLDQLAPDGNSHICASRGGYIFCFIGGSPKS